MYISLEIMIYDQRNSDKERALTDVSEFSINLQKVYKAFKLQEQRHRIREPFPKLKF